MMHSNSRTPNRRHSRDMMMRPNSATTIALLTLILVVGQLVQAQSEHNNQSSLSALDEEILLVPSHDYDRTSADDRASQTAHGSNIILSPGDGADNRRSAAVQPYDHNDPFAVTFEDYYKEASRSPAHHNNNNNYNVVGSGEGSKDSSFPHATAIPDTFGWIIEDEENSIKQKESSPTIDYIFPPPSQQQETNNHHKQDADSFNNNNNNNNDKQLDEQNPSDTNSLLDEIRLLFSWKQILTNKCSKTCGKGFRLNHLYCIDLKYKVRVEDQLCLKSKIPKPNETSDEPCNEVDCPPQWVSTEFRECSNTSPEGGNCHPNLYKRVQCTLVNKVGATINLDDSKCNSSSNNILPSPLETSDTQSTVRHANKDQIFGKDSLDYSIDYMTASNNEKNDIISNIDTNSNTGEEFTHAADTFNKVHPNNEPFFEPGNWSECSGAPCGELGKRSRKIFCRIYLSRSSKFAELPDSSCHSASVPDTHEPCYMDCIPKTEASNEKQILDTSNYTFGENTDETVYDLEMARFVWRKDKWTKCNADCLGGQRESIIECWDKVAQAPADQSLCMEDLKPQIVTESCNEIPCQPEWRLEPFSKCTKTCGSAGIKTRSIACVQQVPLQEGSSILVVSNDLCIQSNGSMPHQIEPCNRIDCKPEWKVGPWSDCSKKCGDGVRNRTVICVQEFAHRNGPSQATSHRYPYKEPNPDLLEALAISSKDWHPGKATQVSFHECYQEYRTVPALDERCFNFCDKEPYIDADRNQNYRMTQDAVKRKTITLRVGGKAQVIEGRNLKIRCKILNHHARDNLVKKLNQVVEWRKDGVKIFLNGSTVADKQYLVDDNLILGGDVFSDEKNQFMADEPSPHRADRSAPLKIQTKARNLNVRSWNNYQSSDMGSQGVFQFLPQSGGRFSLIKENTIRIKRLRTDDSGLYSCSYGTLSESLDLKVVGRHDTPETEAERLANKEGLKNLV